MTESNGVSGADDVARRRLTVRNTDEQTTPGQLKKLFGFLGPVESVTMQYETATQSFCYAVTYEKATHARLAFHELNGLNVRGTELSLESAVYKRTEGSVTPASFGSGPSGVAEAVNQNFASELDAVLPLYSQLPTSLRPDPAVIIHLSKSKEEEDTKLLAALRNQHQDIIGKLRSLGIADRVVQPPPTQTRDPNIAAEEKEREAEERERRISEAIKTRCVAFQNVPSDLPPSRIIALVSRRVGVVADFRFSQQQPGTSGSSSLALLTVRFSETAAARALLAERRFVVDGRTLPVVAAKELPDGVAKMAVPLPGMQANQPVDANEQQAAVLLAMQHLQKLVAMS